MGGIDVKMSGTVIENQRPTAELEEGPSKGPGSAVGR